MKTFVFAVDPVLSSNVGRIANYLFEHEDEKYRVMFHKDPVSVVVDTCLRANYDLHLATGTTDIVSNYRLVDMSLPKYSALMRKIVSFGEAMGAQPLVIPDVSSIYQGAITPAGTQARYIYDSLNLAYMSFSPDDGNSQTRALAAQIRTGGSVNYNDLSLRTDVDSLSHSYDGANYVLNNKNMIAETYQGLKVSVNKMPLWSFVTSSDIDVSLLTLSEEIKNSLMNSNEGSNSKIRQIVIMFNNLLPPLTTVTIGEHEGEYYFHAVTRMIPGYLPKNIVDKVRRNTFDTLITLALN